MAHRAIWLTFAFVLAACGGTDAEPAHGGLDQLTAKAVTRIEQTMTENRIPGATLAVVIDGKLRVSKAFGVREVGKPEPVTPASRFVVGSLSKPVAAAAVLSALDDGKLSLDAPVADLVPFTVKNASSASAITLHQLLSHQAGIVDWNPFTFTYPACPTTLETYFANTPLPAPVPPDQVWMYSSPGFSLAGRALEVADGRSYQESVRARVLVPAGMTRATFDGDEFASEEHVALHVPDTNGDPVSTPFAACQVWAPSAHLLATAEDMAHFAEVLLQDGAPVLTHESFQRMVTPQVSDALTDEYYGYGLWITHYKVDEWTHSGRWTGNRSCITLVPSRNFAAVLMLTSDSLSGCDALQPVVEIYLGLENVPPPSYGSDRSTWDGLTGTYRDPLHFGDLVVSRDAAGELVATFSELPPLAAKEHALQAFDKDIFEMSFAGKPTNLVFWRDGAKQGRYAVFGLTPAMTVFERSGP